MTKENDKMFFVIRKDKWPAGNIKYTIMKDKPFTLTDATRMLLAYEQINDDKDHTYHLNSVDEYLEDPKSTVIKSGVLKLTEDMEVNQMSDHRIEALEIGLYEDYLEELQKKYYGGINKVLGEPWFTKTDAEIEAEAEKKVKEFMDRNS